MEKSATTFSRTTTVSTAMYRLFLDQHHGKIINGYECIASKHWGKEFSTGASSIRSFQFTTTKTFMFQVTKVNWTHLFAYSWINRSDIVMSRTLLYDKFRVIMTILSLCLCFWNFYPKVRQYNANMMKDTELNDEKGKVIHKHSKVVIHILVLSNRYLSNQPSSDL